MERILAFSKWSAQKAIESNAEKGGRCIYRGLSHEDVVRRHHARIAAGVDGALKIDTYECIAG
jgi:hypothetical protein